MGKILLLKTAWAADYWERRNNEAPYPKSSYKDLPEWEELSKNLPVAGLGLYIKQRKVDLRRLPFVYLKITGMRYDEDETPYFSYEPIRKSNRESKRLTSMLQTTEFFSAIEGEKIIEILRWLGEEPPEEWLALIGVAPFPIVWRDYIGRYFLELESGSLGNDEFEDRVATLLTALGFNVVQKGHKVPGEYPDGVASFEGEYVIVYDCKNMVDFKPSSDDKRALEKYRADEVIKDHTKKVFGAFISKSFKDTQRDIFYFPVDALLYLLYKKLTLGSNFNLSPLKKILHNNLNLTENEIDKEWV